jgi:hypothetical protein
LQRPYLSKGFFFLEIWKNGRGGFFEPDYTAPRKNVMDVILIQPLKNNRVVFYSYIGIKIWVQLNLASQSLKS